jgi:hypothetical protein
VLVQTCGAGQVAGSDSASSRPCFAGAAQGSGAWRRWQPHHPVAAQPSQQLGGQVRQQVSEPGHVITGVEDDQDDRVTLAPVPGRNQPGDDVTDLGSGYRGLVVIRAQAHGIQNRRPGGAARL